MKFSINFSFLNFFKFFRKKKKETNTINKRWIEWARMTAVNEVTQQVKNTYDYVNINQFLSNTSDEYLEKLYLFTSLTLTENSTLTISEIKDMFSSSLGQSCGIIVDDVVLEQIANYYFENYYSEELQKEYYKIRQSRN